jgi:uncharacterized membrane protein
LAITYSSGSLRPLHPLHAILLAFPLPLFAGALMSDFAYRATFYIQWANFSSWLIAGGLVGSGFAMLWALVNVFRRGPARKGRLIVYFLVLLVMWVLGFINALVHAKDAWATMPEGLYLSAITTLLALVAAWIGYSGFQTGEVK